MSTNNPNNRRSAADSALFSIEKLVRWGKVLFTLAVIGVILYIGFRVFDVGGLIQETASDTQDAISETPKAELIELEQLFQDHQTDPQAVNALVGVGRVR